MTLKKEASLPDPSIVSVSATILLFFILIVYFSKVLLNKREAKKKCELISPRKI